MNKVEKEKLEYFIEDWHWDKKSRKIARQMGELIFQFINHLKEQGLSERTIRKHESNCWNIGKFECDYGYNNSLSPSLFADEESDYLNEFKKKVSDSASAVNSYKATTKKLARYVKSLGYKAE